MTISRGNYKIYRTVHKYHGRGVTYVQNANRHTAGTVTGTLAPALRTVTTLMFLLSNVVSLL